MRRGYNIDGRDKEALILIMEGIIWRLEQKDIDEIELSVINLGPAQFVELLEAIGYERHEDWDSNGWEQNTWYYFSREGYSSLCLAYSGYYGDIKLWRTSRDEEE